MRHCGSFRLSKKEAAKPGGLDSSGGQEAVYFNALETLLKVVFSCVPRP